MCFWKSERCEPVVQGSVINLSNDFIEFVQTGKAPRKTVLKKNFPLEEEKQFSRLKALDDTHSRATGVSFESFKEIANALEATLKSKKTVPCARKKLLNCLRDNEFCMIKCRKELDKFMDCIDALRIEVIREQYEKDVALQNKNKKVESHCDQKEEKTYLSEE